MVAPLVFLLALSTLHVLMGLFVVIKNPRAAANRYFFGFVICIVGWLITNYFSNATAIGYDVLLLLNKAIFVFPALCAWFVVMFSLHFTGLYKNVRRSIRVLIGVLAVSVALACLTNLVVSGANYSSSGVVNVTFGLFAPFYFIFQLVYFGFVTLAFIYVSRRQSGRADRSRFQLVVAGIVVSFMFVVVTNLLVPLVFHNYSLVDDGPYATILLIASITYAIVKHRLFDVRLVVARSVAYLLLLVTSATIYALVIIAVSRYVLIGSSPNTQITAYTIVALGLAFTFQPLRRRFERITDRIFFQDRYDPREVLDALSRILVSEMDIDRMLARSLEILCSRMRVDFGQMVIFNDDRVYRVGHFGPLPKRLLVAPELRSLGAGMVVVDEHESGARRDLLRNHGLQLSLGIKTSGDFVGYLLLSDKQSGSSFTKSDLELLAIVAKELAVGISNAKAYAEIQAFNLTLQDRVNHATARLRVANRHLKELDKTKDEFISMASHQLRTPLTTIKGYLSMMTEGDAGKLSHTQREFVGYAFDASERMVNLISDLLNVSRLQAGRFMIQTKPTDISAMVADEVRQLQQHARNKGLALTYVAPPETLPLVEIDEGKTRQVIMNFIDNAIYYTKQGAVTVKLSKTPDAVRLEVIDTGIGVPEESKKKLFSKFYRAENAQGVRPDGTGLGLYLARRVIADQNGTIIFKSSEGHGSTFGFELPLLLSNRKHAHHG